MSDIVKPHTLVQVTTGILSRAPAMSYIVYPSPIIVGLTLTVIVHTALQVHNNHSTITQPSLNHQVNHQVNMSFQELGKLYI